MKTTLVLLTALCILFGLFEAGCKTSEKVTRASQLPSTPTEGTLKVLMKDGTLYELDSFETKDSLLWGSGRRTRGETSERYSGDLFLGDVAYVQSENTSFVRSVALVGVGIFFTGTAAVIYNDLGKDQFNVTEDRQPVSVYTGPSGGGSCPLVYSHDESASYLESETFAGAVFKGAERTAYDVMSHVNSARRTCTLTLADRGEETEYMNEMKILAVDAPKEAAIIPDAKGTMHTIAQKQRPERCIDFSSNDRLQEILNADKHYWESDLENKDFTKASDMRDGIICDFRKPANATTVKIVVTGTNTKLAVFAFEQIFKMKGDKKLQWYQKLENDPTERMKVIKFMLREGMLHISVWSRDRWVEQTAIVDVGPKITKSQVALLNLSIVTDDVVRIKLEAATDFWKIDEVYLDSSPDAGLTTQELAPVRAITRDGRDVTPLLAADDAGYYTMLRGDSAEVSFDLPDVKPGLQRTYVLKAKGYYHQWFTSSGEDRAAEVDRILAEPLYGSKIFMPLWKQNKIQYR